MKKTTFNVTRSALEFEQMILNNMDIPRTTFHRRMIDYYLKYDRKVNPNLLLRERSNPDYVRKDAVEQLYLDEKREKELLVVAAENSNCGISVVLFQALLTYCVVQAPIVLGEDAVNEML